MTTFILRRLVLSIPVLVGILIFTFSLNRLIPGDPCRALYGEKATDELCDAFAVRYGLDQPIPTQLGIYMLKVIQGDFGVSIRFGRTVSELLVERLPVTLELAAAALVFATLVGVPLGILSAYRHNSIMDIGGMVFANVGVSMPVFWLGLMLSFLFGVLLKDTPLALPPTGRLSAGANPIPFFEAWGIATEDSANGLMFFISRLNVVNAILTLNGQLLLDAIRHLILPAVAVGTIPLAIIARMTRSSVLEVLNQDYIRTARAKGLSEMKVVNIHAVRNALLPVVTIIGLSFGGLVSGAVLTETIFGFTGIGRTLFEGISARDYSLVQGVTVITAVAFVIINLTVDVLYGYLDPRIRLS
ncbi:MAG TPA: ABC transporter permease [Aggregatilineales bacterium]|nr:ABC transporter permease [Anaerolineae bacterium]HUN08681.1 ABC transporter permease [Aggregatilineales bacterium]